MSNFRGSAYFLAALSALAFMAALLLPHPVTAKYVGLAGVQLPETVAGFKSAGDDPVSEPVRAALAAADLTSRTYLTSSGEMAQFLMIGGTDRSALHDPRSCLVGAGWRIEDDHTEVIPGTRVSARVCRVVQDSTKQANEMVYLYLVDNRIVNQVTEIRFQMLLSALIGRKNTPTVFVRFMRPLSNQPEVDSAKRAQFLTFAAQMWNALQLEKQQTASTTVVSPHAI